VVFLENLGAIAGLNLPRPVMSIIDFVAEEYSKAMLRLHGVFRVYDTVVVLEDERATGDELRATLLALSRLHVVDLLILSHGTPGVIVGYKGQVIPAASFEPLIARVGKEPGLLRLRAVWQMNCHGATMMATWQRLGARSVSGTPGVNWLPEPGMSLFVRRWLRGESFSHAVQESARVAEHLWQRIYRSNAGRVHPSLASSRPLVAGEESSLLSHRDDGARVHAPPPRQGEQVA
jgi:hypothetical protein